jgi:hypothetical protein
MDINKKPRNVCGADILAGEREFERAHSLSYDKGF